jgi:flavorubredoxin
MGLDIRMICPDHGVMWRKPSSIIDAYTRWSRQEELDDKAVVVYDTMWHSTEQMGLSIADGLHAEGIDVRPMKLREHDRSDIMTEVCDARAIVVGSPTLNNGIFPTVADFLTYMKGLKPQNKIGAAFGSYGWSGEAVKLITAELEAMKFCLPEPGLRIQYVPEESALEACVRLGEVIGKALTAA